MPLTLRRRCSRPILLAMLAIASTAPACAHPGTPGARPADEGTRPARRQSDLLTVEDFGHRDWSSVHELVTTLRPNWLNLRGTDTMHGEPTDVRVLLDGFPLGGASATLHAQQVAGVQYLQYHDPVDASGRWGLSYGKGAIYISTRQR